MAAATSKTAPPLAGAGWRRGRGRGRPRGRGLRWSRSPRRPRQASSPAPGPDSSFPSLPPGTEVEVRVDDTGFHGSWFEATVVGFAPARGNRTPARYSVKYTHLLTDDGKALTEPFAPTHIRPRPPPSSPSAPPRFRTYDIVEAFNNDGWWSGIVVSAPDPDIDAPDAGAVVSVAFPITREVIHFSPGFVRPRRDYVDGGWVPSPVAMVVRPTHALKVYDVGDKVEVGRDRDVYGYSWFPATVARVVDDLSYVVEYFDLEEEGEDGLEKATEYLHWCFIRPAVEHSPRGSDLGPGAAVEAYCDGAWSPGVVRNVLGEGEYEVSIVGKKAELMVTKVVELLKPQYNWNGNQWKLVAAKRRVNLRRWSISGKSPSSPVDVTSSGEEQSHDADSSATKKSRKEVKQLDATLAEGSEHASRSEIDTPLSALCKSPESTHSPNSLLSEKDSPQVVSHGILNLVPMNDLCCASSGHSAPVNNQEILYDVVVSDGQLNERVSGTSADAQVVSHGIVNSVPKNGLRCTSSGHSAPVDNQEILYNVVVSDGQLKGPVSGSNADAHDMLSIAELRKKMYSARKSTAIVKSLRVKKGISKIKEGKTHHLQECQGKVGPSNNLKENINFSSKDIVCALRASVEGQVSLSPDRRVSVGTKRGSSTMVLAGKKLANRRVSKELCSQNSSLDVTSTVQQRGRIKVAEPMKEWPLALESLKSSSQEQLGRTLEDAQNITELSNQWDLLPMVPPGFESIYNRKGTDIHDTQLEGEPTARTNSLIQPNRNDDMCIDRAVTVDERSALLRLQDAGSSQCTMDSSPLSCSASERLLPSPPSLSQISDHQVLFVKSSAMWPLIDAMDVFKVSPQQPHFLPLREFSPTLREGMAIGLMLAFADIVKCVREARIDNRTEWFEDKTSTLCHLGANGFSVQSMQSSLTKLVLIKSNHSSYLGELDKLKEKIVGRKTSLSQREALLNENDRAIAELEQKLGQLRQKSQKMAQEQENEEAELLGLETAHSSFDEACGDAEQEFRSVLDGLCQKHLT